MKTAILPLPVEEVQSGNEVGIVNSAWKLFPDAHDALRLGIGEGLEYYGIHKTENCRISADAERERTDGYRGKSRAMQQLPHGITKVLPEIAE